MILREIDHTMTRVVLRCHSKANQCLLNCGLVSSQETRSRRLFYSDHTVINETNQTKNLLRIKSLDQIPTNKSLLPSAFGLLFSGGANYLHEHCDKRHKQLGSIYRERLGTHELIFLSNTKLIQTVIANEGQYPHHNVPECWNYFNQVNKVERGLFFQTGEPWLKIRKALNKVMLADPKSVTRFSSSILQINSDLLNEWQKKNSNENGEIVIQDVKKKLNNWSIECTGYMLFGSRMGCIQPKVGARIGESDVRADELVANVSNMFSQTSKFQLIPVKLAHKLRLRVWKRFQESSTNMLRIATEYATENISKAKLVESSNQSLIKDLLRLEVLSDEEVSRSVVDLIIAAADTTSNSLQWMLYVLAKYPNVQTKLHEELKALSECYLEDNLLEKASYLRAFLREVSRLYPTAPFLARTLDKDIVLDGYLIPAGKTFVFSLYTTSRSKEYFEDPLEFKPERWLRSNTLMTHKNLNKECPQIKRSFNKHAYASLPFGIGARMCVGRRAAELEMSLFIASIVNRFHCQLLSEDEKKDMKIKLNMILCPDKPIRLKLVPRSPN